MRISRFDHETATEADIAAMFAVKSGAAAVDRPADPPLLLADTATTIRNSRPDRSRPHFLARAGDDVLGGAVLWLSLADNLHMGLLGLRVHPDHRRRGAGTALLRDVVGVMAELGRPVLLTEFDAGGPGDGFATAFGFRLVQTDRLSLLRLSDVDWADLEVTAAAKHPGYRIEAWTGSAPDELIAGYAAAKSAMNDAPRDDADFGDFLYTPESIRADEEMLAVLGESRVVVAVHEETGAVAAFTEILGRRSYRADQEDTAVVPAHRGSGLGLWIKSDMLLRLRAERPDVTEVITGNAATNRYMLAINDRLGFHPWIEIHGWQADVAALTARLG
ncbi:MAG TPA: GNAT family N-acetyltransferase [Mycobacteriales bacterium]|jgi:GNAT superfamily N-acetyltransferase|nr:GNAT family N-acetyltransferase [Mycobacteriales bacterium]